MQIVLFGLKVLFNIFPWFPKATEMANIASWSIDQFIQVSLPEKV